MHPTQPPIALRHRSGSEWMRHMAGNALAHARLRAQRAAAWRAVEAFIPC